MLYKTHYESPLGDLLLTADAQVLPITALDTQALDDNRPDVLLLCGGSAETVGFGA